MLTVDVGVGLWLPARFVGEGDVLPVAGGLADPQAAASSAVTASARIQSAVFMCLER